jgi:hypothetical protein
VSQDIYWSNKWYRYFKNYDKYSFSESVTAVDILTEQKHHIHYMMNVFFHLSAACHKKQQNASF